MVINVNSEGTNFSRFPQEIKMKIFTTLYNLHKDYIRSCTVVCKSWRSLACEVIRLQGGKRILRPIAQPHLPFSPFIFRDLINIDGIHIHYKEDYKEKLCPFIYNFFQKIQIFSLKLNNFKTKLTLSEEIVQTLAKLPNLQELELQHVDMDSFPLKNFTRLKVLKIFDSSTTKQGVSRGVGEIATLTQLETLEILPDVKYLPPPLSRKSCKLLAKLTNLTSLDIRFERSESIILFTGLKVLRCSQPFALTELAQLPRLHSISTNYLNNQIGVFFEKHANSQTFKYEHLFYLKRNGENYFLTLCEIILKDKHDAERKDSLRNNLLQQTYFPKEILIGLLIIACRVDDEALAIHVLSLDKTIINQKNQEGETPLLTVLSAEKVNKALLTLLLEKKADPNQPGKVNYKEKVIEQILPLQFVIYAKLDSLIEPLLKAGADCMLGLYNPFFLELSRRLPKCSTFPPYCLILAHRSDLLENMLLSNPRIVKKQDEEKRTLLHWACRQSFLRKDFIELLLKHEAEVNALDKEGNSPLYYLLMQKDVINTPIGMEIFKILVSANGQVIVKGETIAWKNLETLNFPATWIAAFIKFIHAEIKSGILVSCLKGSLILFLKCSSHSINLSEYVSLRNQEGDTPLHLAVRSKDKETVSLLIEAGADLKAVNNQLQTPLDLAVSLGDEKVSFCLAEATSKRKMEKRKLIQKETSNKIPKVM